MFNLNNHPFAVEAFFEKSLVLTYAVPKQLLEDKIPPCTTLDTYKEQWAFVAVALVSTKNLRPKGFPTWMGRDFILIGIRIFVHYINNKGKRLRGLYILKSETNKKQMAFLGNIFTHYNYTTTDIVEQSSGQDICFTSQKSAFHIHVQNNITEVALPPQSPFTDWKDARRFAGPLPFTFTYNEKTKEVLIIEGVRTNWTPKPVSVIRATVSFMEQQGFKESVLANAFVIEKIPYYWKKGIIEKWNP
jgi:Uncharacterized conserved protein (COG2071)